MMAIRDLAGRHVLVTGAATGIGRATARAFAKRGAHLVLSDIDAVRLARTQQDVEALGVNAFAYPADVADASAMREFAAAAREGRPLILVGPFARPMYHGKRVSRRLLRRIMIADARKMGYL
jgi:NAD(P)-dependent dehydrogenase (short-subunit alcohol dehydrogenase family)